MNYGIKYCKKMLRLLEEKEEMLFETTGYGFTYPSLDYMALIRLRGWLKKFEEEKNNNLPPSYNPNIHGEL